MSTTETHTVKLFATLRQIVGAKELTVPSESGATRGTIRELIRTIGRDHPDLGSKIVGEDGRLTGVVTVMINGRNIEWLDGLDTPVSAEDEITLLPKIGGGRT